MSQWAKGIQGQRKPYPPIGNSGYPNRVELVLSLDPVRADTKKSSKSGPNAYLVGRLVKVV